MSYISKTKYLPLDIPYKRSGLVLYFFENNELYFIFALDSLYGELTDLGGSIEFYENFLQGGIRELYEESLGIFNFEEDFIRENSISVYDNKTIIMFQEINIDKKKLISLFKINHIESLYRNNEYIEICSLLWISSSNLKKLMTINKEFKINKFKPTYKESNIPLPEYLSDIISCLYNYDIEHYPLMFQKIKKIIEPVFDNLIKYINR
jgi:hypothetical protein